MHNDLSELSHEEGFALTDDGLVENLFIVTRRDQVQAVDKQHKKLSNIYKERFKTSLKEDRVCYTDIVIADTESICM